MEMRCCVPYCQSQTTAQNVSESETITFHEFPREVHLHAAWLRALGKQDALLPAGAVVCSQHFLDDEIYETESGSRQIRTGAVPTTVLMCLICLDTSNKLIRMSDYKLEQAYEHLVGNPPCGEGKLKQLLCLQCAMRLVAFSTLRDESVRSRCLAPELLHEMHPLPSDIEPDRCDGDTALDATATVAADVAVAVKRELENREHADTVACAYNERDYCKALEDTPAAAEAEAETQTPMKRDRSCGTSQSRK